jgi:hypothetical protein
MELQNAHGVRSCRESRAQFDGLTIRFVVMYVADSPSMPKNWTHALWLSQTTVPGVFRGVKTRSPLLVALDNALLAYDRAKAAHDNDRMVNALSDLFDRADAWKASKTDVTKSIRNRGGNYIDFEQWLKEENARIMPAVEGGWGRGTANCYAYSMKCMVHFQKTPVPGRHAGDAVEPVKFKTAELIEEMQVLKRKWDEARFDDLSTPAPQRLLDLSASPTYLYHAALFEGIQAEADEDGGQVEVLTDLAQLRRGIYPSPDPIPVGRVNAGNYIAAMVVNSTGFHFLRRDSTTHLWSQKNGGQGNPVETCVAKLHNGRDRFLVPIKDDVAVELLKNRRVTYSDFANDFKFAGYVLVPSAGITVE